MGYAGAESLFCTRIVICDCDLQQQREDQMVVAVDGPAGAGKSTTCKLLAKKLSFAYLDTGAMYRAVAWSLIEEGLPLDFSKISYDQMSGLPFHFSIENGALVVYYGTKRLSEELRQPEIANGASRISQIPLVRDYLTSWQRRLANTGDVVAEGRDMTTVVFPDATVKVYLTADLATRARRRFLEYQGKDIAVDYAALESQIRERDKADQERSVAPLRPAADALVLDTSQMGIEEVVGRLIEIIQSKINKG